MAGCALGYPNWTADYKDFMLLKSCLTGVFSGQQCGFFFYKFKKAMQFILYELHCFFILHYSILYSTFLQYTPLVSTLFKHPPSLCKPKQITSFV